MLASPNFAPRPEPTGWKSKAKFHEVKLAVGRNKVHLRSTTGKVTLTFA